MKLLNKLKISLLIALFIIILFNLKAYAVTGTITEITVNMRKEPSTDSKKIMYVTQDYKVEVLEKVGEWYKIKYNGVTGYVFGEYLDVDDTKLEEKEETTTIEKVEEEQTTTPQENDKKEEKKDGDIQDVTTDTPVKLQLKEKADVRLIPNITSSIIYTSKKAISVDVIEQFDGWSYIYVDNIYGWVITNNIIEANSSSSNKEENTEDKVTIAERTVAYIKYSSVNLRKKASTTSSVLAKLKLNNEVIVLEEVNSTWSKVEYDGIVGYVSKDLLSSEKVEEKEENSSTSRDGELVSRDDSAEETTKKEEITTNKDTTVKEENSSNKEQKKEIITNQEEKKEETKKDTDTKYEDTKKEEESSKNENTATSKIKGEEIVEYAKKYLGYKYVYGGSSPKTGFDCSGFTSYVYKQFGYTLSRTSTAQAKNGKEVAKSDLQPGDLLIFKNQSLTRIGHVGIYIGNNKMIHASEPGIGVVITDLSANGYNYNKRFVTARRIVK